MNQNCTSHTDGGPYHTALWIFKNFILLNILYILEIINFLKNTFAEEKIYKIPIIKGSNKAGVVEICRVELWCSQRISIYDWIYALEIQTIWTKVWQLCYRAKLIFTYVNSQSYTLYQYTWRYHHAHNNINDWGCNSNGI